MILIITSWRCCVRGLQICGPNRNRDTCIEDVVYLNRHVYEYFHYLNDVMGKNAIKNLIKNTDAVVFFSIIGIYVGLRAVAEVRWL